MRNTRNRSTPSVRDKAGRGESTRNVFSVGPTGFFALAIRQMETWIPALGGVEAKLTKGAKVADIGCGHGSSTVLLAKAYPNSTIHGIDFHEP